MPVGNEFWENAYKINDLPHFRCPECGKPLLFTTDSIFKEIAGESKRKEHLKTYKPHHEQALFSTFLHCSKPDCKETVNISGVMLFKQKRKSKIQVQYLKPTYIYPPIHLFDILYDCPDEVYDELVKAFFLYWCDYDGCANKIRIAIENLLTDQRIKNFHPIKKGGKKTRIIFMKE